jgi:MtN3 and saliva related transmembrane protein
MPTDTTAFITIIGLAAGTLTTVAYLPQLIRAWRTKSCADVSLAMLVMMCAGLFLWLVYGLLIWSVPVITANVVTLILALAVLGLKQKYK